MASVASQAPGYRKHLLEPQTGLFPNEKAKVKAGGRFLALVPLPTEAQAASRFEPKGAYAE